MSQGSIAHLKKTASGVILSRPDDGYRITQFMTDIPGLAIYASEDPESVLARWLRFCDDPKQTTFEYTIPEFGEVSWFTREMISHVITIRVAFTRAIHPRV